MDLSSLLIKEAKSRSIIEKESDTLKYNTIVEKLCNKRKSLEHKLKEELSPTLYEETLSSLVFLKESMATFGISEIDYQAFIAKNTADEEQLSLF